MTATWRLEQGDSLDLLKTLSDKSIHCVVTSPPYFNLRAYGVSPTEWPEVQFAPMAGLCPVTIPAMVCGLGEESDPLAYVGHLVLLFREVRRTLREDGVAWLNLGDSYAGGGGFSPTAPSAAASKSGKYGAAGALRKGGIKAQEGVKAKDLLGIPWRVAFALQADGWYLRSDIIWSKPNAMPSSVTDRPTSAHEYIFLLSRSSRYFYDAAAIAERCAESSMKRYEQDIDSQEGSHRANAGRKTNGTMKAVGGPRSSKQSDLGKRTYTGFNDRYDLNPTTTRNKRTVWEVCTIGFPGAHFATYPPELIRPCILAGCPVGGTVLDFCAGSGTTGAVAYEEGRNFVGFDLNADYLDLAKIRIGNVQPKLFDLMDAADPEPAQ